MTVRRKPIPQVKVKVKDPDKALVEFKSRGGKGYAMKDRLNFLDGHLWLRGTEAMIKRMLPDAEIIKSVGQ